MELRDLVLGCAEDLGEEGPDAMWGRGVLSFNCLFTPQGELRDPRTDTILSGGIYGPMAGVYGGVLDTTIMAGGSIPGLDTTGRDFAYQLMRWSHWENHALRVATDRSPAKAAARCRARPPPGRWRPLSQKQSVPPLLHPSICTPRGQTSTAFWPRRRQRNSDECGDRCPVPLSLIHI